MDHIFSVLRKFPSTTPVFSTEWVAETSTVAVSSRNTIVFSSTTDIEDSHSKMCRFHVYVADLNMPWEVYKVMTHTEDITCVEWDVSGTKLLVADTIGTIQIWGMKDFHLNEWTLVSANSFPGEHILAMLWFHNGKKMGLNMDKKDSFLYLEKYQHIRFAPSVRLFGGRPSEGFIAVSSSGLVCVMVIQSDGTYVTGSEMLSQFRSKLKVIDMCYAKNGDFLVVTSDSNVQSSIHCYRVTIKLFQEKVTITSQPFSSFYPNCHSGSGVPDKQSFNRVTHLKFVLREAADAVVVSASGKFRNLYDYKHQEFCTIIQTFETVNSKIVLLLFC